MTMPDTENRLFVGGHRDKQWVTVKNNLQPIATYSYFHTDPVPSYYSLGSNVTHYYPHRFEEDRPTSFENSRARKRTIATIMIHESYNQQDVTPNQIRDCLAASNNVEFYYPPTTKKEESVMTTKPWNHLLEKPEAVKLVAQLGVATFADSLNVSITEKSQATGYVRVSLGAIDRSGSAYGNWVGKAAAGQLSEFFAELAKAL